MPREIKSMMAKGESCDQVWGRLIPLFGDEGSRLPVDLSTDLFSIGRKKDCDLKLSAFPVVSGCHCCIIRDPDGAVWLQDSSTNGTIINAETKLLDDVLQIEHNTDFYLVFRRNAPAECVGFRFQSLAALSNEDGANSGDEVELASADATQEMDNEVGGSTDEQDGEAGDSQETTAAPNESRDLKRALDTEDSGAAAKRLRSDSPQPGPSREEPPEQADQGLLETLMCAICQEILHDCVSVQPCLHSFCAGCFSEWMQASCPQCRKDCTRVSRNHLVNNVVGEYLKKHPDQRRPQEETDELDRKNKIKERVVNLSRSSSNDSDSDDALPIISRFVPYNPRPVCPQCPGAASGQFRNFRPDSDVQPPPFFCANPGITQHVLCQCCLCTMPLRHEPDVQAMQRCAVCRTFYCRQYFGCMQAACSCLLKLKDTDLSGAIERDLVLRNGVETRILSDYLREKNIAWRQLMMLCAENFTTHQYFRPPLTSTTLNGDSLVCRSCGQRFLREFAYHYRAAIPAIELPAAVRERPNCHWGRNCRTQVRPHHAERFNHICQQTQPSDP